MNNLVNIIENIIGKISIDLVITSIDVDKYYMCNTLFLTKLKYVKDGDGNIFTVTSFDVNKWVVLEPKGHVLPFSGLIMTVNPITFLHGDPKSVNFEYGEKSPLTIEKTPFIWLVESYTFDDLPRDSAVTEAYNVRLFFMDWANTPTWINDEHNENVIKPMQNLSQQFKSVIENDYNFKNLDTCTFTVRNRFGDNDKLIISEDLSGVEMNFKLEVYDSGECCPSISEPVNTCVPVITRNSDGSYIVVTESGGILELPDLDVTINNVLSDDKLIAQKDVDIFVINTDGNQVGSEVKFIEIEIIETFDFDDNDPANIRHQRSIDGSLTDVNFNQTGGTSQGGGSASTTNLEYWAMDLGVVHDSFDFMEVHYDGFNNDFGSNDMRLEASNDGIIWTTISDNIDSGSINIPHWKQYAVSEVDSLAYRYWRFFIYTGRASNWFVTNEFRFTKTVEDYTILVGDSVVSNSDNSYVVNLPAEQNLDLEDTTYIIQIDGIEVDSQTVPSLQDDTITINWIQ